MKRKFPAVIIFFIMLLSIGKGIGQVDKLQGIAATEQKLRQLEAQRREKTKNIPKSWRIKFKRARHNILVFSTAVNNYYNAVLRGMPENDPLFQKARDMLINGSIAGRHSKDEIAGCPEEYKEECNLYNEIYENLRKMELMAENRHVAFNQFEEQKKLKKKIEGLIDKLEERLKL